MWSLGNKKSADYIFATKTKTFTSISMSFFQAYVSSFINQINSIDPSRSSHQKKDVMLRFLKLSVLTILILIVFFLIYRVRILYHQHLKYQRLQRDEAEVTFYFWYSFIQIQTLIFHFLFYFNLMTYWFILFILQLDTVFQHFEVLKEKLEWTKREYKQINAAFDVKHGDASEIKH